MRIGLVTNLYPPIQTGTSHWTQELARHLGRAGHLVTVVTSAPSVSAAFEPDHEEANVVVHRLPAKRLAASRLLLGFDEFYIANTRANRRRMRQIFSANRVEVLHQCGHLLDLTYATPSVAKQLGIPAVCSVHTVIHSPGARVADVAMKIADRTLVRRLAIDRYDALIALDREIRAYIERTYRHRRVRTVLVSIDTDLIRDPIVPLDRADPFRILSVGHVTSMRSRLDLIEAVERLDAQGVGIELVIVGKICDDAAVRAVRARGLDRLVRFTGEMPRAELLELARTCHMEAHWITVPGLGSATIEAMALGLPVMAYGFPGLYDEVPLADGVNVLFARPGDIGQIAGQIDRLARCSAVRASIGAAGRKLVHEHLSWGNAIRRMRAVYEEVIAPRDVARGDVR